MITIPDLLNGLFEFGGGFAIIFGHCRKLVKDKQVKGVSWLSVGFFSLWGWWNAIFYYPNLNQWMSFWGGLSIVIANTIWLILLIKYKRSDNLIND